MYGGYVVVEVAMRQISVQVLRLFRVSTVTAMLHNHSLITDLKSRIYDKIKRNTFSADLRLLLAQLPSSGDL
jgi:hypothetical protein